MAAFGPGKLVFWVKYRRMNMADSIQNPSGKSWSQLWFRNPDDVIPFVCDTAHRTRAGILMTIRVFMGGAEDGLKHRVIVRKFVNCSEPVLQQQ